MTSYVLKRFLRQLRNNVIAGIFIIIPVAGSVYIIYKLFMVADSVLPAMIGQRWTSGVGFVISVILAYIVGLTAKHWLGKKIIATGNAIIVSIPLLNKIYLVIKQVVDTITIDKKKLFERAVLVEFPRRECFVLGLVTSENNANLSARAGRKLIAVFVPKAPNPTSGFLLYVPEEDCIALDIPVEAALKLVVSGGILGTERFGDGQKLPASVKHWNWLDLFRRKSRRTRPHQLNDPRD